MKKKLIQPHRPVTAIRYLDAIHVLNAITDRPILRAEINQTSQTLEKDVIELIY
jgi:hypothetical protein